MSSLASPRGRPGLGLSTAIPSVSPDDLGTW